MVLLILIVGLVGGLINVIGIGMILIGLYHGLLKKNWKWAKRGVILFVSGAVIYLITTFLYSSYQVNQINSDNYLYSPNF